MTSMPSLKNVLSSSQFDREFLDYVPPDGHDQKV